MGRTLLEEEVSTLIQSLRILPQVIYLPGVFAEFQICTALCGGQLVIQITVVV